MIVNRHGSSIEVLCPAKLNLYLEVTGKRPDGYHDIETVMQTVSLYDRLVLEPHDSPGQTVLECDDCTIPCGGENTVQRAADEMRRATGIKAGVRMRLAKRIPAGAGLAGGSSDAAGAIAGLNLLWEAGLSHQRLARIGAAVGSDVPFFFTAGAALCRGRGEIVTSLTASRPLAFVIAWPEFELSTRDVYKTLAFDLTNRSWNGRIRNLIQLLDHAEPRLLSACFFNRLERTATVLRPELVQVRKAMIEAGLLGVTMTGSGSAFFGLCQRKEVAQEKAERLAASGAGRVFACVSTVR